MMAKGVQLPRSATAATTRARVRASSDRAPRLLESGQVIASPETGVEYRVEWYDGGNNEVGRLNTVLNSSLTADYQRFSFTDTAPAGAASARLVLAVQSFFHTGNIADTSVAWDDASFNTVPAPSACAILALGGLFAGRRRR